MLLEYGMEKTDFYKIYYTINIKMEEIKLDKKFTIEQLWNSIHPNKILLIETNVNLEEQVSETTLKCSTIEKFKNKIKSLNDKHNQLVWDDKIKIVNFFQYSDDRCDGNSVDLKLVNAFKTEDEFNKFYKELSVVMEFE